MVTYRYVPEAVPARDAVYLALHELHSAVRIPGYSRDEGYGHIGHRDGTIYVSGAYARTGGRCASKERANSGACLHYRMLVQQGS